MNRRLGALLSLTRRSATTARPATWQALAAVTTRRTGPPHPPPPPPPPPHPPPPPPPPPQAIMAESEESIIAAMRCMARWACSTPGNDAASEARAPGDEPMTLEDLAAEFNVSRERSARSKFRAFERCRPRSRHVAKHSTRATLEARAH